MAFRRRGSGWPTDRQDSRRAPRTRTPPSIRAFGGLVVCRLAGWNTSSCTASDERFLTIPSRPPRCILGPPAGTQLVCGRTSATILGRPTAGRAGLAVSASDNSDGKSGVEERPPRQAWSTRPVPNCGILSAGCLQCWPTNCSGKRAIQLLTAR